MFIVEGLLVCVFGFFVLKLLLDLLEYVMWLLDDECVVL